MTKLYLLLSAALAAPAVVAASASPAVIAPSRPFETLASAVPGESQALTRVKLWAGDGKEVLEATIIWRDGVITYVGQGPPPATVKHVTDASGRVLTPGIIEVRSILGMQEIGQETSTQDADAPGGWATPAYDPIDGFNPQSEHIPLCRQQGITHVLTGPRGHALAGLAHWVHLTRAPRAEHARPAALWGSVDKDAAEYAGGPRGHLWARLQTLLDDAHFFDTRGPAWERNQMRAVSAEPAQLRALSQTLKRGTPWVLTANRASDIVRAVEFAKSEHISLVISGGAEAWSVAKLLAEADVPVIIAPGRQQPDSFSTLGARFDSAARLHEAGVRVLLSTDLWLMEMPWLRQQAGIAVAHGLPQQAALSAITSAPARVFKKEAAMGSIAKGMPATMVLWSDDPFEMWSRAESMWIAGEPADLDGHTRQRLLFERYHHARPDGRKDTYGAAHD